MLVQPPQAPRTTWQGQAFEDIRSVGSPLTLVEGGVYGPADEGVVMVDLPGGFTFAYDGKPVLHDRECLAEVPAAQEAEAHAVAFGDRIEDRRPRSRPG